jgi:cyanophycin synthetase
MICNGRDTVLRTDDDRIATRLSGAGLTWDSVPPARERVRLHDVSNLSAGGTADDVTDIVADRWRQLAATIASLFNLRFCGVDLACSDIASGEGAYAVIEVNAAPWTRPLYLGGSTPGGTRP